MHPEYIVTLVLLGFMLVPSFKWARDRWMFPPIPLDPYEFSYGEYCTGEAFQSAIEAKGLCFVDFVGEFDTKLRQAFEAKGQGDKFRKIYAHYGKVEARYGKVLTSVYSLTGATPVLSIEQVETLVRETLKGHALVKALRILDQVKILSVSKGRDISRG